MKWKRRDRSLLLRLTRGQPGNLPTDGRWRPVPVSLDRKEDGSIALTLTIDGPHHKDLMAEVSKNRLGHQLRDLFMRLLEDFEESEVGARMKPLLWRGP